MTTSEKIIRGIFNPSLPFRVLWKRIPIGSFGLRLKFDAVEKPQYAFGLYHAAQLAKSLGITSMSAIEFGVAQGHGLLSMERLAAEVSKELGINIEVYGFDRGIGLPKPTDYRDLPYLWAEGDFEMDQEGLKRRLKNAKLILGDVKETTKDFFSTHTPAPIGFISFDLDLYSSTKDAFSIFETTNANFLPRTFCYFDDILDENALALFNDYTGELLAIDEFNAAHEKAKICPINGLSAKRYFKSAWPEALFALHFFDHKQYNKEIV